MDSSLSGQFGAAAYARHARSRCLRCCPGEAVVALGRPPHRARGGQDFLPAFATAPATCLPVHPVGPPAQGEGLPGGISHPLRVIVPGQAASMVMVVPVQPSRPGGGAWLGTAIMSQPPDDVGSAEASDKPSGTRRMIHILGAALVGVVLPVVLLYVFLGMLGSRAMVIGLLVGVIGVQTRRHPPDAASGPSGRDSRESPRSLPTTGRGSCCWPSSGSSRAPGCGHLINGERGGYLGYAMWRRYPKLAQGYTAAHPDEIVSYTAHELRHVCASLLIASGPRICKSPTRWDIAGSRRLRTFTVTCSPRTMPSSWMP